MAEPEPTTTDHADAVAREEREARKALRAKVRAIRISLNRQIREARRAR